MARAHAGGRGFTLPELLVVMGIIGTISTIGVVSYSSARASARDVKRASDMKQIQTALELFFESNNFYPPDNRGGQEGVILGTERTLVLSDAGFSGEQEGTLYMLRIPKNPEPFGSPYVYRSLNADGSDCNDQKCGSYAILFTIEHTQGNYLPGPHAMTPAGLAGAEGGYAGEGVVSAGQEIVGIKAVQEQLDVIASRVTDDALRLVDNKTVETVAESAVAPTVAAAAVANTALTTTSALSYLSLFATQPFALIGRRKRKQWGTVYNALSRLPEDLVIVRLRDAASGRIVKSTVTDMQGRYSFLAPHGSYRLEASKVGFSFPSLVTTGKKDDGPFTDLYHGEVVDVGQEGAVITPNIPVDPAAGDLADEAVLRKDFRQKFQRGVAVLSPVLGGATLLIKPSIFVALLFAAQIVLYLIFRRIAEPPQPKNWGIVYEKGSQRPVSQAILRIFEAKYNKLLETQVTDRNGRYHFRVGSNVYYLTVTKPGYLKTETDPLDLSNVTEATVIASDLPLQLSGKGNDAAPASAAKKPSAIPPAPQAGYASAPVAPQQPQPPSVPPAAAPPKEPAPELPPPLVAVPAEKPVAAAPPAKPATSYEERMLARLKGLTPAMPSMEDGALPQVPAVPPQPAAPAPAPVVPPPPDAPPAPAAPSAPPQPAPAAPPAPGSDADKKPPLPAAWFRDV